MAASTASFALTTAAYQALTAGHASALVHIGRSGPIRLAISTSLPSAGTEDYFPVGPSDPVSGVSSYDTPKLASFEGLLSTENIYARAEAAAVTVRVLRA